MLPTKKKSSRGVLRAFAGALKGMPEMRRGRIDGYPAAFVNKQMFAAVFGDDLMIRLRPSDRRALLSVGGGRLKASGKRALDGYVVVPTAMLDAPPALRAWLEKASAYAAKSSPLKRKGTS